jgi:PAS domain S-box-containing protein
MMSRFWTVEPGVRDALAAGERHGAPWAALLLAAFFGLTAFLERESGALALALGPGAACLGLWVVWSRGPVWPSGLQLFALAGVMFGSTLFRIFVDQSAWSGARLSVALVGASLIAPNPVALAAVVGAGLGVWGIGLTLAAPTGIAWAQSSAGLAFGAVLALLAIHLRVRMARDLLAWRERVEHSEAHLRRAQKLAGLGSAEWDLEQGTIRWSDEVGRIFGLGKGTPQPTLERFVDEMVHPDDRRGIHELMEFCRSSEGAFQREFRVVGDDGAVRWIEGHGVSLRDAEGGRRVVATLLDRTPQRQTQQRERELLRALTRRGGVSLIGEMAAVLAHELRHPLAAIANFANGGLRRLDSGATGEVGEALRAIEQEAERASDTIRSVTQVLQRAPVPAKPVNLAQVAERVARLLDFEVRELGVKVQVRCEGGAAWALANATQVAQILSNLLRN